MTDHESTTALAPRPALGGPDLPGRADPATPIRQPRLLMPRCPNCLENAPNPAGLIGPAQR